MKICTPLRVALATWVAGTLGACEGDLPGAEPLPLAPVQLPAVPTAGSAKRPLKHPNGTLTVFGLRRQMDELMDKEVRVTATVVKHSDLTCEGEGCPVPHMYVADSPKDPKTYQMVVVGYAERASEFSRDRKRHRRGARTLRDRAPVDMDEGDMGVFVGTFTRQSSTGMQSSNGLLDYKSHKRKAN